MRLILTFASACVLLLGCSGGEPPAPPTNASNLPSNNAPRQGKREFLIQYGEKRGTVVWDYNLRYESELRELQIFVEAATEDKQRITPGHMESFVLVIHFKSAALEFSRDNVDHCYAGWTDGFGYWDRDTLKGASGGLEKVEGKVEPGEVVHLVFNYTSYDWPEPLKVRIDTHLELGVVYG